MAFFHVLTDKTAKPVLSSGSLLKLGCSSCPLDKAKLEHPKMPPTGAEKPVLYFIGEAPGEDEDETGTQFIGSSGRFIRDRIPSKWKTKIRWNNSIRCRPPNNRTPLKQELDCCRRLQVQDIVESKPQAVVSFGGVALEWFIDDPHIQFVWRGHRLALKIKDHAFWFYPTIHPSFILRIGGERSLYGADWARLFS